jgi:hypothetical protein
MIIRLKLFELPNMDPCLVHHVHVTKVMPKLKCKNYNINLIKILRVYKEFLFKSIRRLCLSKVNDKLKGYYY